MGQTGHGKIDHMLKVERFNSKEKSASKGININTD